MDRILTIIVPTYNRKKTLAEGLDAIIPQVIEHKDKVALYISDNCSDDGTDEYIQSLHAKYPGLFEAKRQSKNLGAQLNFQDAVRSAKTKYVVLFSDDDLMLPHFVSTIIEQLELHPNVGVVNYNALLVSAGGKYFGVRDPLVTNGVPKYYPSCAEFIKEHTHFPSLVSSNVFNRQAFVDQINRVDSDSYPGYAWYASLLFSAFDEPVLYLDQPLFLQTCPAKNRWEKNAPWYYVYGLGRLFADLDARCPGILDAWSEAFRRGFFENYCLDTIARYQSVYKSRYEALLKYSVSERFSNQLKYYVYRGSKFRYIWLNIFPRMIRLVARILCR